MPDAPLSAHSKGVPSQSRSLEQDLRRSRPTDRPDAHCIDCPFTDRGDWLIYRDEYERLVYERDRAIETRENANRVSVRVEIENRELREVARALASAYMAGNDIGTAVARLEDLTGGQQSGV